MESTLLTYNKGEFIFRKGSEAEDMYIIRSGKVRILKDVDRKMVELATFGEGEFLGELAVLAGRPHAAAAIAIEDCTVAVLKRDAMMKALEECPRWVDMLLHSLANRLTHMNERIGIDLIYIRDK